MKLRNKKTGKIIELNYILVSEKVITLCTVNPDTNDYCYGSLDEICKEWEDYIPKEPIIKDEKIRKAVKAWADAEKLTNIRCYQNSRVCEFYYENMEQDIYTEIKFIGNSIIDKSLNHNFYTITELCGEEEECES